MHQRKEATLILVLLTTFVLVTSPGGEQHVRTYEGQSQATIQNLLTSEGKTGAFITAQQYADFIEAHKPPPLTPEQILADLRLNAIRLLSTDTAPHPKLIRALLLILLDEINVLRQRDVDRSADVAAATTLADLKTRWAARTALNARTATQLRTAIENRINSGDAD